VYQSWPILFLAVCINRYTKLLATVVSLSGLGPRLKWSPQPLGHPARRRVVSGGATVL